MDELRLVPSIIGLLDGLAVVRSFLVTTVPVVGFISAGPKSIQHIVGVIMGANVGTTIS